MRDDSNSEFDPFIASISEVVHTFNSEREIEGTEVRRERPRTPKWAAL